MYNYKWGDFNSRVFLDAKDLRELIFVKEQGFLDEFDEYDKTAHHLVLYENEKPIATARVVFNKDNSAKVGRICVLKNLRAKGLGSLLLKEAENFSLESGYSEIHLGAQIQALDFYEKIGYKKYGKEYLDETTPHINMKKYL